MNPVARKTTVVTRKRKQAREPIANQKAASGKLSTQNRSKRTTAANTQRAKVLTLLGKINSGVGTFSNALLIFKILQVLYTSPVCEPLANQLLRALGLQFKTMASPLLKVAEKKTIDVNNLDAAIEILRVLRVIMQAAEAVQSNWKQIDKVLQPLNRVDQKIFRDRLCSVVVDTVQECPGDIFEISSARIQRLVIDEDLPLSMPNKLKKGAPPRMRRKAI